MLRRLAKALALLQSLLYAPNLSYILLARRPLRLTGFNLLQRTGDDRLSIFTNLFPSRYPILAGLGDDDRMPEGRAEVGLIADLLIVAATSLDGSAFTAETFTLSSTISTANWIERWHGSVA